MRESPDSRHNALPLLYMTISVVASSSGPVLFKLGGAEGAPFLFTGIWQASAGLGMGAIILLFNRRLLLSREVLDDILYHCGTARVLVSMVGHCGYVLFALGLVFVDASIAAILYANRTLFLMLLLSTLFFDKGKGVDDQRFDRLPTRIWIFVVVALAGVALVILSQNNIAEPILEIRNGFVGPGTLIGASFVLLSAVCVAALRACVLKTGTLLAEKHSDTKNRRAREVLFATVVTCVGLVIAGVVLCAVGLARSETLSLHQTPYAVMGALFVNAVGVTALKAANLTTRNLGVNAFAYATPLIALIWLWIFSTLDVPHLDYLIIGGMGVVAANLLINTRADKRIAYNALVVSLWVFGSVVWFTGEYLTNVSLTTDVPLELPVTMFILVLAFRVDRLVRRTSQEEEWMFEALHKLEFLSAKKRVDDRVGNLLLKIDKSRPSALNGVYESLIVHFPTPQQKAGMDKSDADDVTHVQHLVDNLVHSRQQGGNFGELIAIAIAGGLIVIGLLFFREREIFSDIAAFLLSSVVVFLLFNIVDLQNDRSDPILRKRADGRHTVKFDNEGGRKNQQRIAVVTSLVMVSVFVCMFWWR